MLAVLACSDDDGGGNPVEPDTVNPSTIADLAAANPTGSSISLTWTAPGDDSTIGKVREYRIRYSHSPISSVNWDQATPVTDPPTPKVSGSDEAFDVTGLDPDTVYYFAVRGVDEAGNSGDVSNSPSSRTLLAGTWDIFTASESDLPSDTITVIETSGIVKWIGTTNGLARFDGTSWQVFDTVNSQLPGNLIADIESDGGTVWIATWADGLSRYNGVQFTNFAAGPGSIPSNALRAVEIADDGTLWVGSASQGLFKYDGSSWIQYTSANSDLPANSISSLDIDSAGRLWIGLSFGGLSRTIDGTGFVNFSTGDGLPAGGIWKIRSAASDSIWFATDNGLALFDGSDFSIYSDSNGSSQRNIVLDIALGQDGHVWLATVDGLNRFTGADFVTYLPGNSGLPHPFIRTVTVDLVGTLWLGGYAGLVSFAD